MPIFKPFRGIRPCSEYIDCFPTHPLSNYTQKEIEQKAEQEFSYVKMVSPYLKEHQGDFATILQKIRDNYENLLSEGTLKQDNLGYYLYRQQLSDGRVFRGLLGLVSVDEFNQGKIKKHEETLAHRKEKLAKYLEGVNLQAEPVLLTYPAQADLEHLMDKEEENTPTLDFSDSRNAHYKIWEINGQEKIQQYMDLCSQIESFYIADGHHRMGATALCAERKREKSISRQGDEPYNYIYSFIVSDQCIKINDFNKLVTDLNGLSSQQFLDKLQESFVVEYKGKEPFYPSAKGYISMYLEGEFYEITLKNEKRKQETCLAIDHDILDKYIMTPILGIENLRTTKRVGYLRGSSCIEGIIKLKEKVDREHFKVAFAVYPVSFSDLLAVADKGLKMPPKCTYIEPKLITGLIMYDMK